MGGNAFNGSPIIKYDIFPTVLEYKKQILDYIPNKGDSYLGSTGKKLISNDIDLGIDTSLTLKEISEILCKHNLPHKIGASFGIIYTLFPIYQWDNECKLRIKTEKEVQIDLIPGNLYWLRFAYWAPDKTLYTAHHRSILLAAITRYCRGIDADKTLVINWNSGIHEKYRIMITKKDGTKKEKIVDKNFITNNPAVFLQILSDETKSSWKQEDILQSFEGLWEKTKQVFDTPTLEAIKGYCIPAIKQRGIGYIVPPFD